MSEPLRIGSLCTGYGGLDQAIDGDLTWVADNAPAAVTLLNHHHPTIPNLGDITTTDWEGVAHDMPVDVITAGYP